MRHAPMIAAGLGLLLRGGWCASAQPAPPRPPVVSPEVAPDAKVTFRLRAAAATSVRLESPDIPNLGPAAALAKADDGAWQVTVGPVPPGAYRYAFNVDGLRVVDPENPDSSQSNGNTSSLVLVPGSAWGDTRAVPHGAVAEVIYASQTLGRARRMHVYTPPGYESGAGRFPVLYLFHGASDSDDSWSTIGRAGAILDNLLAAGKAVPMVVVMPDGHTGRFSFGRPDRLNREVDRFVDEFAADIRPYVESHYRVGVDRASRAVAGLSMGGAQALEVALRRLPDYAYLGVFSSGVFSLNQRGTAPAGPGWEQQHQASLDNPTAKAGLRQVWFATGKADFLLETSRATVRVLRAHGFTVGFRETDGGHTWLNWRDYLADFLPLLFQPASRPN